jgi:hypothetical protein
MNEVNEVTELQNGETFKHDGVKYLCLKKVGYKSANEKMRIRNPDTNNFVGIKTAIEKGLITDNMRIPFAENEEGEIARREIMESPLQTDLSFESSDKDTSTTDSKTTTLVVDDLKIGYGTGLFHLPTHYIQVQSYLASGLIYPSDFESNSKRNEYDDLHSYSNLQLCFLQKPTSRCKNELVIAVFITRAEYDGGTKCPSCLLIDHPIPISRIKRIYVPRGDDSLDIYLNGWLMADVPVPRHLFQFLDGGTARDISDLLKSAVQSIENAHASDYKIKMKKFDQRLGSLAYMHNVSKYYSNRYHIYEDMPNLYIKISQWLLRSEGSPPESLIGAIFDYRMKQDLDEVELGLSELLDQEENAEKETIREIARKHCGILKDDADLFEVYKRALGPMQDYMGALELLHKKMFDIPAWILVVIFQYRMKNSNDYRNIKQKIYENWSDPKIAAKIMAYMGAYYGYTRLDAREYTLYSLHPEIAKVVERRPEIKFHLRSLHERLLIETIYRLSFDLESDLPKSLLEFFEQSTKRDSELKRAVPATRYLKQERLLDCPYLDAISLRVKPAYDLLNAKSTKHPTLVHMISGMDNSVIKKAVRHLIEQYVHEPLKAFLMEVWLYLTKDEIARIVSDSNFQSIVRFIKELYEDETTDYYMNVIDEALTQYQKMEEASNVSIL